MSKKNEGEAIKMLSFGYFGVLLGVSFCATIGMLLYRGLKKEAE